MRASSLALLASVACVRAPQPPAGAASSRAATASESDAPAQLLARAIERAGGVGPLEAARALVWEGEAVVHAGGRTVPIAGRWAVQPPDTAVVATYAVARGPETTRALVLAAPRGWTVAGGAFTPFSPALLANERAAFYLYDVLRLVPLRAPAVTLGPVERDSLGQRGFRATQPGRPDVELYVDASGRAAHLRATLPDAATGAPVVEELWLEGTIEAAGVRWPRSIRITVNGAPYFDLTLRTLRVQRRLDDPLLAGPAGAAP